MKDAAVITRSEVFKPSASPIRSPVPASRVKSRTYRLFTLDSISPNSVSVIVGNFAVDLPENVMAALAKFQEQTAVEAYQPSLSSNPQLC
jgi:hypothetical protein